MPNNPQPQRPGRLANFFGRTIDRIVPGNNWNPNAAPGNRLTITPGQAIGAIGSVVGNAILPGSGPVIRGVTHGATTGEGVFGFLQPRGNFTPSPITTLPFTPNIPSPYPQIGPAGITPVSIDPAAPIPVTTNFQRTGPLRLGSQTPAPTTPVPTPAPRIVGIPNMGGARGMRGWGGAGITGDAARAFMQSIHMAPGTIYTGSGGQRAF